ncbi:polyprenyl diphosphate synthase [Candidatus Aalborgicola defluviihabitans]|uniref:polyprenyl diphosphate synthase n=1 Tax=Candidatus Aalborgicola defluviihabitans TaxID=3386187 RepID=UPI001D254ED1|nr:di-trans,poly-cis-decaprenylcistransferase [Burkholderiales bacterium]MBL0244688.1 di-trans,poly-cis-decaprenylcistransferase [Rhodoferax sp.]
MAEQVSVPRHIAIVMDGNGRWASKRFLPRVAGHKQGVDALKRIVSACPDRNIKILTVFAFSSENWNRPAEEVSGLMDILALALSREVPKLMRDGVRIHFVGARDNLSARVKKGLEEAEAATAGNSILTLNVCFNYGGRWDIAAAAARLAAEGTSITEASLSAALALAHCADPDLIIRTGNEKRLSNFLLWQAAYSELYFSKLLWPDFDEAALDAALLEYASRERRFGKTSNQVVSVSAAPLP